MQVTKFLFQYDFVNADDVFNLVFAPHVCLQVSSVSALQQCYSCRTGNVHHQSDSLIQSALLWLTNPVLFFFAFVKILHHPFFLFQVHDYPEFKYKTK